MKFNGKNMKEDLILILLKHDELRDSNTLIYANQNTSPKELIELHKENQEIINNFTNQFLDLYKLSKSEKLTISDLNGSVELTPFIDYRLPYNSYRSQKMKLDIHKPMEFEYGPPKLEFNYTVTFNTGEYYTFKSKNDISYYLNEMSNNVYVLFGSSLILKSESILSLIKKD